MNNRKMGTYIIGLCVCLLGILWLGSRLDVRTPDENKREDLTVLTIGTADSGGTMYPVGRAIANELEQGVSNMKINTSASSGSHANVEGLRSRQIDLGLVSGDVAYSAYMGTGEFVEHPMEELRAIGAVYTSLSQWIVLQSGGVDSVSELKGKRIALGPEASTTELSAHTALGVLGIDSANTRFENYGLGSGGEALKKGTIDGVHGFAGIPISGMETLAEEIPCRILGYEDEILQQILEKNPVYTRIVIPAGTYEGQDQPVTTFGVKCLLTVRADMDEELVYAMTSILHQEASSLSEAHGSMGEMTQPGFLYQDLTIPLHTGAQRYYREQGLITSH